MTPGGRVGSGRVGRLTGDTCEKFDTGTWENAKLDTGTWETRGGLDT